METDAIAPRPTLPEQPARRASLKPRVFWRMGEPIPARLDWILRIASVIVPLVLWWLLSNSPWVNPKFLPSPIDVIGAFGRLWDKGLFLSDL
ncbi:MAG: ABC transporter permease, partial [Cyanobacteria bacterium P01_C01_bin.69]